MTNQNTNPVSHSNKTCVLIANRTQAHLFETQGSLKHLSVVDRIEFPAGRLKNREIDEDRNSGGASTSGPAYPVHGMVNKGEAHFHMTQVFARQLSEVLNKGRVENSFHQIILVAEDRFLGEILASLDPQTKAKVASVIHKDIAGLSDDKMKDHLYREEV